MTQQLTAVEQAAVAAFVGQAQAATTEQRRQVAARMYAMIQRGECATYQGTKIVPAVMQQVHAAIVAMG